MTYITMMLMWHYAVIVIILGEFFYIRYNFKVRHATETQMEIAKHARIQILELII